MLFWLALLSFVLVSAAMIDLVRGNRSIRFACDVRAALPAQPPRVSLVIAARDEERNLEAALDALLAQDYPDFEVIVVDDRSTDATPVILARKAAQHARLRIVRIDALPAGWLGKNHALERGAHAATGAFNLVRAEVYRAVGMPRRYAIGFPLTAALFVWILWRATFITLRDDGITWRGTHYPLTALKANRV